MMYGGSKKKKKMMMYGGKKKMMQAGGSPEDRIKPKKMVRRFLSLQLTVKVRCRKAVWLMLT